MYMNQEDFLKRMVEDLSELDFNSALGMALQTVAVTRIDGIAAELLLWLQARLEREKDVTYSDVFGVICSASWLIQYLWASGKVKRDEEERG